MKKILRDSVLINLVCAASINIQQVTICCKKRIIYNPRLYKQFTILLIHNKQ